MNYDILGYRDWAKKTASLVEPAHFHRRLELLCKNSVVFATGWSTWIPRNVYEKRQFFVVHPSPLPKYRGGSPIQNQLLAGETESAVTIFKLDRYHKAIDSGPIAWQEPYPLRGELNEILDSIARIAALGIQYCIDAIEHDALELVEQDESQATTFKRREPQDSEITLDEIASKPAWWLDAKIRGLQDPYPNPYIWTADGHKLYLKGSYYE